MLLQQDPQHPRTWLPVGQYSHTLNYSEKFHSKAELELVAVHEALHKLQHMTVYAADLHVEVTDAAKALIKAVNRLHPSLQWRVADILMYGANVRAPTSYPNLTWCGGNEWAEESASSSEGDSEDEAQAKRPVVLAPRSRFG